MIGAKQRAFTLIELMLVLVILTILAAVVVPVLMKRPDDARARTTVTDIGVLKTALSMFYLDNGRFPTTEEGLWALVAAPPDLANSWGGPYVEQVPPDKWGNAYRYMYPSPDDPANYLLFSCGKDGVEYTEDDITQYTTMAPKSGG